MNVIWTIRELCSGENGLENLFDGDRSYEKLLELSDDKQKAILFAALLYGNVRGTLIALIHDAYNRASYEKKIKDELIADGMSEDEAKHALDIFYEAFGFPGYRRSDPARVSTLVSDDGKFRTEYRGEIRDGKEHGVGERNCYYNGRWCSSDEAVWSDGVICGYDKAKEEEFGFIDKKEGFVAGDCMIGKIRVTPSDSEAFDDIGKTLDIQ